jgi:hypothetical protein
MQAANLNSGRYNETQRLVTAGCSFDYLGKFVHFHQDRAARNFSVHDCFYQTASGSNLSSRSL